MHLQECFGVLLRFVHLSVVLFGILHCRTIGILFGTEFLTWVLNILMNVEVQFRGIKPHEILNNLSKNVIHNPHPWT
jgi:hypothetical protein